MSGTRPPASQTRDVATRLPLVFNYQTTSHAACKFPVSLASQARISALGYGVLDMIRFDPQPPTSRQPPPDKNTARRLLGRGRHGPVYIVLTLSRFQPALQITRSDAVDQRWRPALLADLLAAAVAAGG
jgi:hypothetical protein